MPKILKILSHTDGSKRPNLQQSELKTEIFSKRVSLKTKPHEMLSDREFAVMYLIAFGINTEEIAEKLSLRKHTVSIHRNNIFKKMNLDSDEDLTRYALKHGILKRLI